MRRHTHTHTQTRVRSNIMRGYTHTHTHTQQKVPQLLNPMEQSTDRLTIDRATLSAVDNKCRYADRQRPKHQTDTLAHRQMSDPQPALLCQAAGRFKPVEEPPVRSDGSRKAIRRWVPGAMSLRTDQIHMCSAFRLKVSRTF